MSTPNKCLTPTTSQHMSGYSFRNTPTRTEGCGAYEK